MLFVVSFRFDVPFEQVMSARVRTKFPSDLTYNLIPSPYTCVTFVSFLNIQISNNLLLTELNSVCMACEPG